MVCATPRASGRAATYKPRTEDTRVQRAKTATRRGKKKNGAWPSSMKPENGDRDLNFRALSLLIYGTEDLRKLVRQNIYDWLEANKTNY